MTLAASIEQVSATFTGQLLQPADAGYDEARRVHNGLVDKRPALVARCRGTADVVDAVKLARAANLEIAIRGGGHNVAGRGTVDGGIMIDLAPMNGITVDARARTAKAQGGVLWKEFNRETQVHGLATTGGVVGTTGIAGLTLGGGLGWLMPKYGLALDNLLSAEVVTADGSVVRASHDENPDLFWALRGGGGNFGAVTTFEYQLHQVGPIITGGLVAHPIAKAKDVLRMFREQCEASPDEQMLAAGLLTGPDGSKLVGVLACHCGSLEAGEKSVRPIKTFGSPVLDVMGPIPYTAQNGLLDASLPKGALNYWKSQFLTELSDAAIDALVDAYQATPSPMSQIVLEHFHGAASRVPIDQTACTLRAAGFNAVFISQWMDPAATTSCTAWCRDTFKAMQGFFQPLRYLNYLDADDVDPAAGVYGKNYERLQMIKRKYDPENVFHLNVNVRP